MNDFNIKLYDSTLRDGAQTKGVNFSLDDKLRILNILCDLEVDYIEEGGPVRTLQMTNFSKICPKLIFQK